MNSDESPANRELADLLPFYVTGRLPLAEMERVEVALAKDDGLRRELALVEEEQAASIEANERLGLPSARAGERFLAALDAEPARSTAHANARDLFAWIGERLQAFTPRQMAYAGIAAALLIVAQAGFIGALLQETGGQTYTQASLPGSANEGSLATLAFNPDAKAADLSPARCGTCDARGRPQAGRPLRRAPGAEGHAGGGSRCRHRPALRG